MINNPAATINVPSTAAEINSAFPCPYGWSESFGFAAMNKEYKPMKPASIFTILSNASVSIANEWVK